MNRKTAIGCGLPILLVIGGIWYSIKKVMDVKPTPPATASVSKGDVEIKVVETGTIEALRKLEVKSKVAGRLAKLYVKEGDRVTAGQILADIDPTEINSQVDQMKAQLEGAKARYDQAVKGLTYQKDQTIQSIAQQIEAVKSAEARVRVAEEESRAQPALTSGENSQAEAALRTAIESLELLKGSQHPQAVVAAETGLEEARIAHENAMRHLERQQTLYQKGFSALQAVDTAKNEVASTTARFEQARKRMELIKEQNRLEVASAQNRVEEARANLLRAQTNKSLLTVKEQELLSARATLRQARAQLILATKGKEQDRMRLDDIRQAQASVLQIENQLNEIRVHQSDTKIIAGNTGTVTRKYMEEGELVTSGVSTFSSGTPIVQIADLSRMLVKMTINEVDVHKVRQGFPVEIGIDGAKGVIFNGHVTRVAPAAVSSAAPGQESSTPTAQGGVIRFAVEVEVDHPDARLKPGMSARCSIVIARKKDVIRVPSAAVNGSGNTATVQMFTEVIKDGKPEVKWVPRTITAGLKGDSFVEVISGLKAGDKVSPGAYSGPERKGIDLTID